MSDAQRQVSSRRLPPLSRVDGGSIYYEGNSSGSSETNVTSSYREQQTPSQFLNSLLLEGPFRPVLKAESFFQTHVFQTTPFRSEDPRYYPTSDEDETHFIESFLQSNPVFLDEFVRDHVPLDKLQQWLVSKTSNDISHSSHEDKVFGIPPSSQWKNCSAIARQHFINEFISEVHRAHSDIRGNVLSQLADSCAAAVDAQGHFLYLCNSDSKYMWLNNPQSSKPVNLLPIKEGSTLASYVAATKESIRINEFSVDDRFPDGIGILNDSVAHSVLCQPVVDSTGELTGVLELVRTHQGSPFAEKDEQIVNGFLTWGGIVAHYAEMYHNMHKQRRLNEFLLIVTKSIFQDIVSMDTVIMKIMNFAQTLVDADRTSLFLVDTKTDELYARIFDIGNGLDTKLQKEIRFPKSKGVAGHVATTGQTLNITDAYTDSRFNRDIDVQTGYTTRTLLCMPIFIRGNIIGVVQMVNKKTGIFTLADENAFQTFAIYCGLALHHAKLYDKIRRSEQKYKVALEVLSYHSMCNEEEMAQMKALREGTAGIDTFEFNHFELTQMQMAREVVYMFEDLFNQESAFYFRRFDIDELTRFTLTVRKNYRRVPYHNWVHAFAVAHCMFCVLRNSKGKFNGLEAVALFVACLCHDLDHRGKNNDWMKSESTPLAAVYTTSTLEHHHFNQTITILQHEGHNIFSHLSSSEYKQVLGHIKDCILSTDLASFFGNKARLKEAVDTQTFDWKSADHRKMVHGLAMTACDLSACSKPWKIQYETVKVIFQEFYAQGDEEKALGRTPVPMMDRDTADKLPQHQVTLVKVVHLIAEKSPTPDLEENKIGFLVGICVPCYDLLQRLVPQSRPLVEGAKKNLQRWSEMVSKNNDKRQTEKAEENARNLEAKLHDEIMESPSSISDRTSSASSNKTNDSLDKELKSTKKTPVQSSQSVAGVSSPTTKHDSLSRSASQDGQGKKSKPVTNSKANQKKEVTTKANAKR